MIDHVFRLRRGFDIPLLGEAERRSLDVAPPPLYALKPPDVPGLAPIPKLIAHEGDEVRAGTGLFFDKTFPDVRFCAPVAGEVVEIRRGAKRAIREVVILADREPSFENYPKLDPASVPAETIVSTLARAGAWPLLRQRPFNVLANPSKTPRDIFVSCFDSAPLAPDTAELISGSEADFTFGLAILRRLTSGDVHLGVRASSPDVFRKAEGVRVHTFEGPHPAGNVGVQIHHVSPIAKGDIVWTVKPQDVAIIGRLASDGLFDPRRKVAVTGAEVLRTGYVETRLGASILSMVDHNLRQDHVRFISGNVLSGTRIEKDGFLGLFDDQVTVIEEGDEPEFMGWLMPTYRRPSVSRTFLSSLVGGSRFRVNSNTHGELRAFVMSGEYEKVVPMDLYPQHLIKSILYEDFDQMEGLGIYEVVEEDVALCEFVCTSKQPVQRILRDGLDALRNEG